MTVEDTRLSAGRTCPIGSYGAHTWNHENTECIWCGPNSLGWKGGKWVEIGNGFSAWREDNVVQGSGNSEGNSPAVGVDK